MKSQMPVAPLVWPSVRTPWAEVDAIKELNAHLIGLEYSLTGWRAGLLLYQTAKRPSGLVPGDIASRWRFVAANECVLELFHLRARLHKIQSVQLRKCPSLRASINVDDLRVARGLLDEYFPSIEALRHAIAHKGENEAHPEIHALGGEFALYGFREPDVFSAPYKGQLHRLALTLESLERIGEVIERFFGGFANAAALLATEGHLE